MKLIEPILYILGPILISILSIIHYSVIKPYLLETGKLIIETNWIQNPFEGIYVSHDNECNQNDESLINIFWSGTM